MMWPRVRTILLTHLAGANHHNLRDISELGRFQIIAVGAVADTHASMARFAQIAGQLPVGSTCNAFHLRSLMAQVGMNLLFSHIPAEIAITVVRKPSSGVFISGISGQKQCVPLEGPSTTELRNESPACFRIIKPTNFTQFDVYVFERHLTRLGCWFDKAAGPANSSYSRQ